MHRRAAAAALVAVGQEMLVVRAGLAVPAGVQAVALTAPAVPADPVVLRRAGEGSRQGKGQRAKGRQKGKGQKSEARFDSALCPLPFALYLGWMTGIEPATSGATVRRSNP